MFGYCLPRVLAGKSHPRVVPEHRWQGGDGRSALRPLTSAPRARGAGVFCDGWIRYEFERSPRAGSRGCCSFPLDREVERSPRAGSRGERRLPPPCRPGALPARGEPGTCGRGGTPPGASAPRARGAGDGILLSPLFVPERSPRAGSRGSSSTTRIRLG